jgi:hypothetical protein
MDEVMGYYDNDLVDSMIDASLRDPTRQFTEQTMPGLDMYEAFSGGEGSTADLARGVAERGYADRAADVGAQIRGGAYNTALNTALRTRGQDQNMASLANNIGLGNIEALLGGGGMLQDQDQAMKDAAVRNWGYNRDAPWQWAENYSDLTMNPTNVFGMKHGYNPTPSLGEYLQGMLGGNLVDAGSDMLSGWLGDIIGGIGAGGDLDDLFDNPEYF